MPAKWYVWFNQGRPVFYVFVDGQWVDVEYPADAAPFALNQTYHFAGTWDGEAIRFYIDGTLVAEAPAVGELRVGGNAFTIGADTRRRGPRNSLDGWIDGVRLSDTVRYIDEGFVPARRPHADDDTLLLLQMDAAQGAYLYDHSGRAAHPILRNDAEVGTASVE
ncbi:MAG: LamG domain-containing protein [Planctomycetota bacterium]